MPHDESRPPSGQLPPVPQPAQHGPAPWGPPPVGDSSYVRQGPYQQPLSYPMSVAGPPPFAASGVPPKGRVGAGTVVALIVVSLLAGGVAGSVVARQDNAGSTTAVINQVTPGVSSTERSDGSIAATAAQVLPSVVYIEVEAEDGYATGSGFVISEDGHILTNNHVVEEAAQGAEVVVTFSDGQEEKATLVGRTVEYDIAVIKVDRTGLKTLTLGDSDSVVVGDSVIAVGAPLGLEGTVTTGIVSALNRPVTAGDTGASAYINAIQTDAAINPGNSGGPLINNAGEVIGINSAIAQTPSQIADSATGNIGLGFAISSNQATRTAQEIIKNGYATYPIIGVMLDGTYTGEGVRVVPDSQQGQQPITANGPADKAGIKAGDVILAIDGRPVSQSDELIVAIRAKAPGDDVKLTVRSGSSERDIVVTLDEAKSK